MGKTIRTFVAIHLPENVLRAMGDTQDAMRRHGFDIRWVRPAGIHLTLKFIGDIAEKDVEKVEGAMGRACEGVSPFQLKGEGIGVFPNMKRPRVVWVGVAGEVAVLLNLQKGLDRALADVGFPREKRPFKGHLTLGRVKSRVDTHRFSDAMKGLGDFTTDVFEVDRLILFKSTLRPQGAIYDRLVEMPLTGR